MNSNFLYFKNNNNKTQGAIEFIIILTFVLFIIGITIYGIASLSIDINKNNGEKNIGDFAKSITSEFEMLQKVEEGYSRNITIPYHLAKKFKPEINSSYLILRDIENIANASNIYYYSIPENTTYFLTNDTFGNYYLYITKKAENKNAVLELIP